jgi:hypothetical protein
MDFGNALEHYVKAKRTSADPREGYEARMVDGEPAITRWEYSFPKPTQAELEAADLEARKAAKIDAFARRAVEDLDATGLFTSGHGDRETLFVIAKTLAAISQALSIPLDARLEAIAATGDKAMTKKAAIEAATTEAEVEAVTWT